MRLRGLAGGVLGAADVHVAGRLQRFTRSGFKRLPTEHLQLAIDHLV